MESARSHRPRLSRLDDCLTDLEDAHERGEHVVDDRLASRLHPFVPTVMAGMPIAAALDRVFEEQEACLEGRAAGRDRPTRAVPDAARGKRDRPRPQLDVDAARELTERIRTAARWTCLLLAEAHQGRAWSALGYRTWEQYVRRELGLSRRRSYELLDQALVIRALQAAAGTAALPHVSAYAALQIKPHLATLTDAIRRRTVALPEARVAEAVGAIVEEFRARIRAERPRSASGRRRLLALRTPALDVRRLHEAIESLNRMPPPADAVAAIDEDDVDALRGLECALWWLTEFTRRWRASDPAAADLRCAELRTRRSAS